LGQFVENGRGARGGEIMSAIHLEVPDEALRSLDMNPETFARDVMTLAAVKLFELGKLSSGGAARLAGMERVEFLLALREYQVSPFQTTLAELKQDAANA
jgi:predicted HTH domain antitoxin